jgi:hypothetical protein
VFEISKLVHKFDFRECTLLPYGGLGGGFECNQSNLQLKADFFEAKLVPYASLCLEN